MKFIGLDIGTTSISAVVLDSDDGRILSQCSAENDSVIQSANKWERIGDPDRILEIVEGLLTGLCENFSDIAGLGLTGQMHGIIYVDGGGRAVSPLITWQDGRGDLEYRSGCSMAVHLSQVTGHCMASGMGCVTHAWNQANDCTPAGAEKICTIADYVAMKLTGRSSPVTDVTNAASLGCFDVESLRFDGKALDRASIDQSILPTVSSNYPPIGDAQYGFPVYVAVGDNQASFLGSVRDPSSSALVNVGTGGQVSVFSQRYIAAGGVDVRPFPLGGWLYVGASLCGGRSLAMLKDFFAATVELFGGQVDKSIYEVMSSMDSAGIDPSQLMTVDTRFKGSRTEPSARGRISNISPENFTPENLILAFQQGIAAELHEFYRAIPAVVREGVAVLAGSGNGIRRNSGLRGIIEDQFGMKLHIPAQQESAASGAALVAAISDGAIGSISDACGLIQYKS